MTVTIGRRELVAALGGAAAAWPLAARAQQAERARRIGVLMSRSPDNLDALAQVSAFTQGLQERGRTIDAPLSPNLFETRCKSWKPIRTHDRLARAGWSDSLGADERTTANVVN